MKTKFNNSELSHVWANQTQAEGRGSNIFFKGKTIYSYGYHFKIAQFIENNEGERCVFVNSLGYSKSTAKHQGLVIRAIPQNIKRFKVISFFDHVNFCDKEHKNNLNDYLSKANENKNKVERANKNKEFYINNANGFISDFEDYVAFFKIAELPMMMTETYKMVKDFLAAYISSDKFINWQTKKAENELKAQIKAKEDAKEKIELFRQFKISSVYANFGHHLLRYNKETENVETSGGVKMPKYIFIAAYQRLINKQLSQGQHIAGYQFNGIINDTISVGCHKIPMAEITSVIACMD